MSKKLCRDEDLALKTKGKKKKYICTECDKKSAKKKLLCFVSEIDKEKKKKKKKKKKNTDNSEDRLFL